MSDELEFIPTDDHANDKTEEITKDETISTETSETVTVTEKLKHSNAIQSSEYSNSVFDSGTYRVSLPSVNLFDFSNKVNEISKLNLDPKEIKNKKWKDVSDEALGYYTPAGLYQDRFNDVESEFKQGIETEEGAIKSIDSLKFRNTEGELRGEVALLKVSKMLGLGDVITVPLPHSGIWVTLKPPTEKDLIDFYNSVFREKVMLGRSTYGLTLTNFSVHINKRLFDFILKHIHSVNNGDIEKENLGNYMLIHDFHILAWGFACSMYPNGYNYERVCTALESCGKVVSATLNLTKLLWIDNNSLTQIQKGILFENRPNKLTIENYKKFISEHTRTVSSTFSCDNGISIKLRVPTFNEYTSDGLAWINKINNSIEHIILENESEEEDAKTELLNQYVKSSILRQFNHFIDYIELDQNAITDRETINSVLEAFSAEDKIRSQITENILKFKVKTTLGIIGIPEYNCPHCKETQNKDQTDSRFVNVIPLDSMSICFLVLTSKISKILEREV